MARKNRVSVCDGVYHVTTRIANRAMLLEPDEVKERLMDWVVSIADFSGVEVWGFTIMDNHLHLIVHVPQVPRKYWLDPDEEPAAYAFGMRPPECRAPLWNGDCPPPANGDCPPPANGDCPRSPDHGDCPRRPDHGDCPRRPPIGFMLEDDEMLERLSCIYDPKRVEAMARAWACLREDGRGYLVDDQKARYCRRMYNLSQYLKTLKETVSMWYNGKYGHQGSLWEGRFYSGLIDRKQKVLAIVAAYVAYNPVKAKIAPSPAEWKWSSYALAVRDDGEYGCRCRAMYERMFGQKWDDVRSTLESIFADRLPSGITPEQIKEWYDDYDEDKTDGNGNCVCVCPAYRASQAIRVSMKVFRSGAYITDEFDWFEKLKGVLPKRFPRAGKCSVKRCRAFFWELPERKAA